jgi:signal transduction histidine kinase
LNPVDSLIRFSELASRVAAPEEILPLLAKAAVDYAGADAAVVVVVEESGSIRVAASCGLPGPLQGHAFADDALCTEAGADLLRAAAGRFEAEQTLLLVSGGDLFGALVLLRSERPAEGSEAPQIARALADLAAIALGQAARYAQLERSYAELRASREALKRTHKLRALGQMAAGVSHDLKNLLNPLSLYLQLAKRALAKGNTDQVAESLSEMQGVVKRGVETIDRLRDFSRQSPDTGVRPTDLNAHARESMDLARAKLAGRKSGMVHLDLELGSPPIVFLQSTELVGALVNLIVNAIDAMPDGGRVVVSTGGDDDEAWVRVADDGPGMTPEIERRVFEPFFTTKGDAGTGLGLAMVFAFVERSGGRISLDTSPGHGAAFTLRFPAVGATSAPPSVG